ncbi:class I SAM-dependent methyltransferase [Salirhabdus salicampi]|uniref:class I SAM-dependent methyltransferase n=1 Tax=Salirhabdus salicampi TaxID=476102 RepID=UPI0020C3A0B1|nr:class I SAM-dependent methyltransferase [Salirhabdus salicampi]MCP8617816.1 methyltransferase domain-containing protein [Salirhabdus salicampi]
MLKRVIPFAHELLEKTVSKGDIVIDGTAGNGNDTIKLAQLVGEAGHVYAFDIQEQAIQNTSERINDLQVKNVSLIQDSHEKVLTYLREDAIYNIGGAIFNLGYLPGSDKSVITKPNSTWNAVQTVLTHLKRNKVVVLVVYYGHEGGNEEKNYLLHQLGQLPQKSFNVLQYRFLNQQNSPPFVLAIEKK